MKINRSSNIPNVNPYQQNQSSSFSKVQSHQKKDELTISDTAKKMLQQLSETDSTRQKKVDELQYLVDKGHYEVDSSRTAEKLYEFWFKQEL